MASKSMTAYRLAATMTLLRSFSPTVAFAQKEPLIETRPIKVNDFPKIIDELADAKNKQAASAQELDRIKEEKQKLTEEKAALEAESRRLSSRLEELQNKNTNQTAEITSLTQKISSITDKITSQDEIIKEKNKTISVIESALRQSTDTINSNQNKLQNAFRKRRWLKIVTGAGLYRFRTPDYRLAPKSPGILTELVIRNNNSGEWESDALTGVSFLLWDPTPPTAQEQAFAAGPFLGLGGRDLFKNYYVGGFLMYRALFLHVGVNIHQFEVLQDGFKEGDTLPVGTPIPTRLKWEVLTPYVGVGLDLEFIAELAGLIGRN